jgi:hypothetical protein
MYQYADKYSYSASSPIPLKIDVINDFRINIPSPMIFEDLIFFHSPYPHKVEEDGAKSPKVQHQQP